MTERKDYVIDTSKIKTLKDVRNIFECLGIICDISILEENDPRYELAKEYFVIPCVEESRKSLDEIQQELDEKFEKLIEKTHLEYRIGHNWLYKLRRYEEFCKRQDADFEHAKKYGSFPISLTVGTLDGSYLVSNGSSVSWGTEFRICNNNKEVGWWEIKPNIKVYLGKKPNPIVRYFTKLLLDFTWKNK